MRQPLNPEAPPMLSRDAYRTQDIPNLPGVYVFRDRLREVIYVGKAKSLRRRLANYFQPSRQHTADPKLRSLIHSIAYYDVQPVRTDPEALLLESQLIKQYAPRYNVLLRDDKRFLLIKLDLSEPFPRLILARLKKDDGCLYFGPFPLAGALRDTVDFLSRHFGLRSCRARVPGEQERRHCHDHIVRDCSAPCVGKISAADYQARVRELTAVIEGRVEGLVAEAETKMQEYAARHQFELAARLRDVRENLQKVFGAQNRTFVHRALPAAPGADAVAELGEVLALPRPPRRIECFDNSNIMGQFAVASMVCFIDGQPARKEYRHYRIRTVAGIDDFAMMHEIVQRRYLRLKNEGRELPDLVVVDGGRGQLGAAYRSLSELGLAGQLPLIALAKRHEEIYTVDAEDPLRLERHEASLRLLQALRDEAHRFAIAFHRDLRRQRILDSLLDEVPGIGKKRKTELLKAFGSVRNLRHYDAAEIVKRVPGIGEKLAGEIMAAVQRAPAGESDEPAAP